MFLCEVWMESFVAQRQAAQEQAEGRGCKLNPSHSCWGQVMQHKAEHLLTTAAFQSSYPPSPAPHIHYKIIFVTNDLVLRHLNQLQCSLMISGPHFQRPKSPNCKALGGVISSFFLGWGEQGWPRARSFSSIHQRLAISLLMRKGLKRDAVRSQWSWSHLAERTARWGREIQWTPPKKTLIGRFGLLLLSSAVFM